MSLLKKNTKPLAKPAHGGAIDDTKADETKTPTLCFHCLEPTPKYSQIFADVDGRSQAMCCYGCKAAAEFIDGQSLSGFYVHRQSSSRNRFFAKVARKVTDDTAQDEWRFLDTPPTSADYVSIDSKGQRSIDLIISGLYCSSCSWLIDKALKQLSPEIIVRIQLDAKRARITITDDAASLPISRALQVISDLGYKLSPIAINSGYHNLDTYSALENQKAIKRILVAGLGMMQVMTYAVALYLGELHGMDGSQHRFLTLVSMLVATLVVFYSGKVFFINALNDLRNRHFGMDVPIAFAIAGAYFPSVYDTFTGSGQHVYFDSAVMFIFFLLIGRYLEMRARHKLSDAPTVLMRLLPNRVNVQRLSDRVLTTFSVKPQEVEIGDQLVLNAGNVVPFDADIISGNANLDESLLSGEVKAVPKASGDSLLAGSKLLSGELSIQARCVWGESSIVKIETLLNQSGDQPTVANSRLQKFSQTFVLAVLILTTVVAIFWWFYDASRVFEIALAMLIASCPCAFSLASHVGATAASNGLRKQGILIANSNALQKLSTITHWYFDKTGTLTNGKMTLQRLVRLSNTREQDCINIAAALEKHSNHSLARAFIDVETPLAASSVNELAGNGISGLIDGETYFLGKREWVLDNILPQTNLTLPGLDKHCSEMLLANKKSVLALILVADELREGTKEAMRFLTANKKHISILSGDTSPAVATMAKNLSIEHAHGAMLPEQKMQTLRSAQSAGECVAMVGDGLNDAQIMSKADLSIAMASGSELTQSQADVVLVAGRLDRLICLHQVAGLAKKITNQNLTWALLYNAIVLPLAAFGYLSPWLAALGMSSSSLLVVLNALRIRAQNSY